MSASDLILVAAITWDLPEETKSTKLKVYRRDFDNVLTGRDLLRLVNDQRTETGLLEIYDPSQCSYMPLDTLLQDQIVPRFGTRIRINVRQPETTTTTTTQNLAIMGRFFPYDAAEGISISGKQLKVQELANQENVGTGVNVWDGALLLYVNYCLELDLFASVFY